MRIRKRHHRNSVNTIFRVPAEHVGLLLKSGWDGGGRANGPTLTASSGMEGQLIGTTTRTGTGTEQVVLDGVTTISRQSASPGVSMLQQGHVVEEPALSTELGSKSESDVIAVRPGGSRGDDADVIVDHGAEPEGSSFSVEQLWRGQDGEVHATRHYVRRSNASRKGGGGPAPARFESSMAAAARPTAVKSNRNDGVKPPEESAPVDDKMETASSTMGASKRKQLPLEADEDPSETESEGEAVHPWRAAEGSVLHTLYLQLLAAGSEGMTLRELFASFKKQTALPSLASDWKQQVRAHLKNNRSFGEAKGHYLLCEQVVQRKRRSGSPKRAYAGASPGTTSSGRELASARASTVESTDSAAAAQPGGVPAQNGEGVQTRRKAYEKTIEAVLKESALEFQKMQGSWGNTKVASASEAGAECSPGKADPGDSQVAQTAPEAPGPRSRKRKLSSENEEVDAYSKTIRGSLQAMQARILAESGVQRGAPCSRKDDARKWRCPLMATEGHTLCEHHRTLQLRKRVRKQEESKLGRRSGEKDVKLTDAEPCPITDKEDVVGGLGGPHAVEALMDLHVGVPVSEICGVAVQAKRILVQNSTVEEGIAVVEVRDITPPALALNLTNRNCETPTCCGPDGIHRSFHFERASPGSLKILQAKILAEGGERSGVRCARKDGSNDSSRKWQCPLDALPGHTLCEHHKFLKERKRAFSAAARVKKVEVKLSTGQRQGPDTRTLTMTTANNDASVLPVRTTQVNVLPAKPERHRPSEKEDGFMDEALRIPRLKDRTRSHLVEETVDHDESTVTVDEEIVELAIPISTINAKDPNDDTSSVVRAVRLLPQLFKNAPKQRYMAAKKTAVNVETVKENLQERETSPLIRPPTIPPLPAMYGVRRKAVKN